MCDFRQEEDGRSVVKFLTLSQTVLLIMFLPIPSTSYRKLKKTLNGTGLYFERSSHYLMESPSKLDAAIKIEPGWIL